MRAPDAGQGGDVSGKTSGPLRREEAARVMRLFTHESITPHATRNTRADMGPVWRYYLTKCK